MLNPFNQIQPVPKKEGHIPSQPYPTVMIPGIGPCMMIPQENPKLEQNGRYHQYECPWSRTDRDGEVNGRPPRTKFDF